MGGLCAPRARTGDESARNGIHPCGAVAWGFSCAHFVRHLLPNTLQPVLIQATIGMAGAILAESTLSFLGLGVVAPTPSWGAMLNDARNHLFDAPHLVVFPRSASWRRSWRSTCWETHFATGSIRDARIFNNNGFAALSRTGFKPVAF